MISFGLRDVVGKLDVAALMKYDEENAKHPAMVMVGKRERWKGVDARVIAAAAPMQTLNVLVFAMHARSTIPSLPV